MITYHAPVACTCGHSFTGTWASPTSTETQECPRCNLAIGGTWGGWDFPTQSVILTDFPELACETVTASLDARTVNP